MDPATKFHIKQNIIKKHMGPDVSYKVIGKMCIMEKVYPKVLGHSRIYENLFNFMKEHNIEPKERFPDDFEMPWLVKPNPDKEWIEGFKTIDEIDETIHESIPKKDLDFLDVLIAEKDSVQKQIDELMKILEPLNNLIEIYKRKK